MRMFRITHKFTARGVYHHNNYCVDNNLLKYFNSELDKLSDLHSININNKTPCLSDDRFNYRVGNSKDCTHIYGFKDLDQLHNWFTLEELKMLSLSGFRIIEIEVPNLIVYQKQVVTYLSDYLLGEVVDILPLLK